MDHKKDALDAEDWKAMYMILLDGITGAMNEMPLLPEVTRACEALIRASHAAEERCIAALGAEEAETSTKRRRYLPKKS